MASRAVAQSQTQPHGTAPIVYLKKPPPQTVLEEDDYLDSMSEIIQRDFFPELKKLKVLSHE